MDITEKLQEIESKLHECFHSSDTEIAHCNADNLLCEALVLFGQKSIVDIYSKIWKWYA